jgi:hypothetical protein
MLRIRLLAIAVVVACSGPRAESATDTAASSPTVAASPAAATPAPGAARVFEIRTYTTHPGRLDALHARFRQHTIGIFERHGMTSIGYWTPTDSAGRDNTLIYIIAHASRAQADSNWAAFNADPEWQKVRADSEKDGPIIDRIERVYVAATDYSPIK